MRSILVLIIALCGGTVAGFSQEPKPGVEVDEPRQAENRTAEDNPNGSAAPGPKRDSPPSKTVTSQYASETAEGDSSAAAAAPETGRIIRNLRPLDYSRPLAKRRFSNYLHEVAGPFALVRYAATAGLLTWRNTPKEWGKKSDGYGRRLANVAAKNFMRTTTTFALDEALKVDSAFYLSRDRSVAVRLRNSVFSAVTARNRRGQRVIGIPRLAGSIISEVVSSVAWYPSRYDQDHGLKGGAISIGLSAGVNLLREFVIKR